MTSVPKIIYASRTHSQLTQVVSELKKLRDVCGYFPEMSVIGGRSTTCLNPKVSKEKDQRVQQVMCSGACKSRKCFWKTNLDRMNERNSSQIILTLCWVTLSHNTMCYVTVSDSVKVAFSPFCFQNPVFRPWGKGRHNQTIIVHSGNGENAPFLIVLLFVWLWWPFPQGRYIDKFIFHICNIDISPFHPRFLPTNQIE